MKEYTIKKQYERPSKTGKMHKYFRNQTIAVMQCDNCNQSFERPRASMSPKRLSNNYYHVCDSCDAKVFAQRKGVERKKIWDLPASLDIPINRL